MNWFSFLWMFLRLGSEALEWVAVELQLSLVGREG